MEDFIVLIILWGLFTFFGKMMKGKKKPPVKKPGQPGKAEPEIPPFLRELLGLPKETPKVPPVEVSPPQLETTDYEAIPDTEFMQDTYESDVERKHFVAPVPAETKIETSSSKAYKIHSRQSISKRRLGILSDKELKRAILLKEVLGQPVSMRPFQPYQRS